jgi:hypothetical protein
VLAIKEFSDLDKDGNLDYMPFFYLTLTRFAIVISNNSPIIALKQNWP